MRDEPLKEAGSSEAATSRIEIELLQTETREVQLAEKSAKPLVYKRALEIFCENCEAGTQTA